MACHVEGWLVVFEIMELRRTFGHRRVEVIGEWRKQHNVEFHYV
jgi:hypothetical protein